MTTAGRANAARPSKGAQIEPEAVEEFVTWRAAAEDRDLSLWDFLQFGASPGLATVASITSLCWPRFLEREGCVLLADNSTEEDFRNWWSLTGGSRPETEAQLNHVHLDDLLHPKPTEFGLAAQVAEVLREIWLSALAAAFPERAFVVQIGSDAAEGRALTIAFWQL